MLSLVFSLKGLQDFAKQRARTLSEFDQGQVEAKSWLTTLSEAQRLEAFKNSVGGYGI
jgi:hypothetical protein